MHDCDNPQNHQRCIHQALETAQHLCTQRSVKLTRLRRMVLTQIWQTHEAVKAYDLIRDLSSREHMVKPPTVYRTLDFLLEQGLIHRIESLNAYVGCPWPDTHHQCCLLICRTCGQIQELKGHWINSALQQKIHQQGFVIQQQIFEIQGICRACVGVAEP
ncbi:transcriptional repressor [Thiorhodospira sibirica]|uniref:transcriptional repressor n=1 Tax=Thiorhodospira sibirica TaxID=154347 RepID=UPI00022C1709|nr:transcriptional repressor [Thiorhodospira sibirica]